MAGPLSSEEIEDVVSSVRRLVSNEQSSRRLSRDLGAEKLLLTPALRVVSETSRLAPLILETQIDEPAADTAEEIFEDHLAAALDDDAVELIEADWEDELWAGSDVVPLNEVALTAEEAEVLSPSMEDAEDILAQSELLPAPWAEAAEPIPFIPLRRRTEELAARLTAGVVVNQPADTPQVPEPALEIEASADTEKAEEAAPVIVEPDEPLLTPSEPVESRDPQPQSPPPHSTATEIVDADGTPLAVLDEAALQEIVRQMIREELQGDLGDRSSRNLSMLVRAVINRALMARDLD